MTPKQRETIREVIGHLWTIDERAVTETMSSNYAEILEDMLDEDAKKEERENG